jgi:hypothetical protein
MKIITDIKQLEAINNAVKERENNPDSQYCELNKHASQELYAVPIMADYLKGLKLPFITDEWLNTDIVEQIPDNWTWHVEERPIRMIIPNEVYTKMKLYSSKIVSSKDSADMTSIKATTESIIPTDDRYIFVDEENIVMYLEELTKEIEVMITAFEVIKFETN